jgi:hypothetical protein
VKKQIPSIILDGKSAALATLARIASLRGEKAASTEGPTDN